jgi:hypothetical protein
MALATGKSGTIGPRDEEVFKDLFLCEHLFTPQLERMHFPGSSKVRDRLSRLRKKGYLDNLHFAGMPATWRLTKEAHVRHARVLGIADHAFSGDETSYERIRHHLDVTEIYVKLREKHPDRRRGTRKFLPDEEKNLDDILDPYPQWEWISERRASHDWTRGNDPMRYRPDAEVRFGGMLFIIERQTGRARKGPGEIYSKVENHKLYARHVIRDSMEVEILFACDKITDIESAERASEELGIYTFAGTAEEVVHHIKKAARDLSSSPGWRTAASA